MQKVLVIVGPTAVGKSAFGIKMSQMFNGEIISGDSVQIYKGLDIGSAKVDQDEQKIVKHHLIDIKEPTERYSVKEFQTLARELIENISEDHKLPIIVGGTGLYIKATLYDYEFNDENESDNPYDELTNEQIYEMLKTLDSMALQTIHINNRKRLVRALNLAQKNDLNKSAMIASQEHKMLYDALIIGLTMPRDELYKRIDSRVDKMIENGLLNEIENLLKQGVSFDDQAMQAIGYKELKEYFNQEADLETCANLIKRNSRRFAKRQYTWFNHQTPIMWFDINDLDLATKEIAKWIKN